MGIARRAIMRVDADAGEGELGHVGAADQDGAGGSQASDDRRVELCRRHVVERFRAGQGALARNIEQILDRHRQSGERRGDIAGSAQAVLGIGGGARGVAVDFDEGARPLACGVGDPRQRRLDQRPAGGTAGRQILGQAQYGRFRCDSGRGHDILVLVTARCQEWWRAGSIAGSISIYRADEGQSQR